MSVNQSVNFYNGVNITKILQDEGQARDSRQG